VLGFDAQKADRTLHPLGTDARRKRDGTMGWMFEKSSHSFLDKKPRVSAAPNHKKSERQQTQRQGSSPVIISDARVARRSSSFVALFFDRRLIAYRARTRYS
jgi:hypothetical protein